MIHSNESIFCNNKDCLWFEDLLMFSRHAHQPIRIPSSICFVWLYFEFTCFFYSHHSSVDFTQIKKLVSIPVFVDEWSKSRTFNLTLYESSGFQLDQIRTFILICAREQVADHHAILILLLLIFQSFPWRFCTQ